MAQFGFIGMGNMGYAMLNGVLGEFAPGQIIFTTPHKEKCEKISAQTGVKYAESNAECANNAKYIILAVKPQMYDAFTSVAVVIIASLLIKLPIFTVNLLAPPICPDNTLITYFPFSSMFKIAGSVIFELINGAMLLINIPEAIIAIIASYLSNNIGIDFLTFL